MPAQMETAKRFASGPARDICAGRDHLQCGRTSGPTWLVLKGEIDIMRRDGLNDEAAIARMDVGQFTGEMSQLSGRGTLAIGPRRPGRLHRAAVRRRRICAR